MHIYVQFPAKHQVVERNNGRVWVSTNPQSKWKSADCLYMFQIYRNGEETIQSIYDINLLLLVPLLLVLVLELYVLYSYKHIPLLHHLQNPKEDKTKNKNKEV